MDTLIKRKTLRAKQGKQRWRKNIDTSLLQQEILENKGFYDEPVKKIKGNTLTFTVDKTRQEVDYKNVNRFKKQPTDTKLLSKYEQKQIKVLTKIKNLNDEQDLLPNYQVKAKSNDPWNDQQKKKKTKTLDRPKFIMKPSGGQSYNPSQDDYQQLLDHVVTNELQSGKKKLTVNLNKVQNMELRELRRKELMKLRKVEREQGKKAIITIEEKKKNHSFNLIKKLKKEQQEQRERLNIKRKGKTIERQIEQQAFKEGRLPKPKKIGRKTVKLAQEDFLTDEQLPEKLRSLVAGDRLIHNHFESFFRRGLLEPKGASNKLRSSKIPKFKIKDKVDPFAPKKVDVETEEIVVKQ